MLDALEEARQILALEDEQLADMIAEAVYGSRISGFRDRLPPEVRTPVFAVETK